MLISEETLIKEVDMWIPVEMTESNVPMREKGKMTKRKLRKVTGKANCGIGVSRKKL